MTTVTANATAPSATPTTPPRSTLTPAEMALAAAVQPGKQARLHIEGDANPGADDDCLRLLAFTMAASSATAPGRIVDCVFPSDYSPTRYRFSLAADGSLYLDAVQLLLKAKATLPRTQNYSACADIREHFLPATEPADTAAYTLVCWQAPPLPTGAAGGHFAVWGAVEEAGAQTAMFPAGTYCWQLVRTLGAPSGKQTRPMQCLLD